MQFKSIPWWLWLLPVAVLLIATARLPYGYYMFTRVTICGSAALIAFIGWEDSPVSRAWSVIFALLAVLFNPIFPEHVSKIDAVRSGYVTPLSIDDDIVQALVNEAIGIQTTLFDQFREISEHSGQLLSIRNEEIVFLAISLVVNGLFRWARVADHESVADQIGLWVLKINIEANGIRMALAHLKLPRAFC